MTTSRREFFRLSKNLARELGVGKMAFRIFLLGHPKFSLFDVNKDDIRRSLKYADEVVGKKEHSSIIPSILMIT
ncbi:MAG: hypothetical protein US25_C0071G0001 [Candidatus Moranbacteria bacterium GW2011_GWE1_36_7]|nr:MAG: hypothetical protein UR99_C0029G0001 [Candidatus Moranbacteria bacterium GW2011_GWD2_36_12]KKQ05968.1 MAG: hypothetical protein US16_C0029G0001 [Candidatus Moranbacteria bacterium GW2011_GWE2_36_40]KKQ11846.1 MAG: hypothetical protein US25_C0071G0001 [Candidatus Moranbacteria bacterium GW2011_GWE1_36_7]